MRMQSAQLGMAATSLSPWERSAEAEAERLEREAEDGWLVHATPHSQSSTTHGTHRRCVLLTHYVSRAACCTKPSLGGGVARRLALRDRQLRRPRRRWILLLDGDAASAGNAFRNKQKPVFKGE